MEYAKDIILDVKYKEEDKKKKVSLFQKHKLLITISGLCGILILLDGVLVYNFIALLQTME